MAHSQQSMKSTRLLPGSMAWSCPSLGRCISWGGLSSTIHVHDLMLTGQYLHSLPGYSALLLCSRGNCTLAMMLAR